MFMISNMEELSAFIISNDKKDNVGWEINQADQRVYFRAEKKDKKEIPSTKMINIALEYATEMNRII